MSKEVRNQVQGFYGKLARELETGSGSCCWGSGGCGGTTNPLTDYALQKKGEIPVEAINASLGCGNPLVFAQLKPGEVVLDLGSGGGIDTLLAAKYVGPQGKVYGLDMTDEMLSLANQNKVRANADNVEFIKGYIEEIPLPDATVDVIMSNCVINLSNDKERAVSEAYRVLKPGGRVAIADIVTLKDVPTELRDIAELWMGCIAGTIPVEAYRQLLVDANFRRITIRTEHVYTRSVIQQMLDQGSQELKDMVAKLGPQAMDQIDGAFAGAYITAVKQVADQ